MASPGPLVNCDSFMSDTPSNYLAGKCKKYFNDPIHGYISFDGCSMDIVDTPQFQRLRYLKQMGSSYFVFPGACHNRFEHCLGVGYLAGTLTQRFKDSQPELEISDAEVRNVQIAGLCHDLGHGPFSHVFDAAVIPTLSPQSTWKHEQGSLMMFDYLVEDNYVDIDREDVEFIKDLIMGRPQHHGNRFEERRFLFDIVANQRNGVDVDKFDYISRDCYNVNLKSSYDSSRLMIASRVINDQICYDHKEVYNIYDMFHTRYSLFKRIYTHRVAVAIELMLVDAIVKANSSLNLLEKIQDPEQYLYLTDGILHDILRSSDPALAESKRLIKRIQCRQLYKFVDEFVVPGDHKDKLDKTVINAEAIVAHQPDNAHLSADDVIVEWLPLSYGKKDQNPVNSIQFYNKFNDYQSFHIPRQNVSCLIPTTFSEMAIRVYARDINKVGMIQRAFRRLMKQWQLQPNSPQIDYVPNQGHEVPGAFESPRKRRLTFLE